MTVGPGDFVFVRTGAMAASCAAGAWGDYAGGDAPGLGLDSVGWVAEGHRRYRKRHVGAGGPTQRDAGRRPALLHIVFIVHMGLWLGEIFDLDPLAEDCAADGAYEFMFCGPPLPFTRAVGSPLNPMAIK